MGDLVYYHKSEGIRGELRAVRENRMKRSISGAFFLFFVLMSLRGIKDAHAWLLVQDERCNKMTVGENDVGIEEEFPDTGITPGKTLKKQVEFSNTGTVPCYVRAKYLYSSSEAEEKTVLEFGEEGWSAAEDGYFYYEAIVLPGEKTKPFLNAVKIKDESTLPENFDLILYTETVQSQNYETAREAFAHLER